MVEFVLKLIKDIPSEDEKISFLVEEYNKLQAGEIATDINGKTYSLDDDGKNGNDTTDSEATRISHKYLRWKGVVP